MNDLMKLNLRRFDDEEAAEEEAEAVDVPDRPGVGGVLTVWAETVDDTFLNCKWLEIREAIDKGWVVAVFDGEGHCTLATAATVDETGDDPVYNVTVGSNTYSSSSAHGRPMLQADAEDQGMA